MTQIVVDTDVVSFLFKNHPIGASYDPELASRLLLVSFMTVAEVERWALRHTEIIVSVVGHEGHTVQQGEVRRCLDRRG